MLLLSRLGFGILAPIASLFSSLGPCGVDSLEGPWVLGHLPRFFLPSDLLPSVKASPLYVSSDLT